MKKKIIALLAIFTLTTIGACASKPIHDLNERELKVIMAIGKENNLKDNWYDKNRIRITGGHVRKLNLEGMRISRLPQNIGDLREFNELNLSNNNLKALPESMRKLGNLRELNLKKNDFQKYPHSILKDLRQLDVEYDFKYGEKEKYRRR